MLDAFDEPRRHRGRALRRAFAGGSSAVALLSACSPSPPTVFDRTEGPLLLSILTYDGSDQVVHPDVVRVAGTKDPVYWMAITPYPASTERFENPCVYRSLDGLRWEEPAPDLNPIAPPPPYDHNCDPDLVHRDGEFLLFYLETQRKEYRPDSLDFQELRVCRSPDGIQWSAPSTRMEWDLSRAPLYVSPAVVQQGDSWRLYLVDGDEGRVDWVPSADLVSFGPVQGTLETGLSGVRPWHIDVFPALGGWVALLCARGPAAEGATDLDLWIGATRDLQRWTFRPEPLLRGGQEGLGVEVVYRSTGLVEGDRLAVWYSGQTAAGEWRLGTATFDAALVRELLAVRGRAAP